ncbi:hypothetical protein PMAYCL1PPCAC_32288, partial [Pristionchus mayeri]
FATKTVCIQLIFSCDFTPRKLVVMPSSGTALNVTRREVLPPSTLLRQTDDGTVYYVDYENTPFRLYVKWEGRDIHATLPGNYFHCPIAHGNSVYFKSKGKIYEASFTPEEGIRVTYLRDELEDEDIPYASEYCSRVREGKTYWGVRKV